MDCLWYEIGQKNKWHTKPLHFGVGVYTICSSLMKMQLTGSEKLVFIASFMVLMNWGVRLSSIVITNFL